MAALLSGLLLAWALPPDPQPLVAAAALVPITAAVAALPPGPDAAYRAWRLGAAAGAVAWALLLRWIVPSLALLHPLPLALATWAAMVGFLAALTGAATLLLHRLHHRHRLPLVLALPVAWTGVEWLRAHLGDLSFPWLELGASLTAHPALLAPAEWSGARGLSFWLAAVAGWAAGLVVSRRGRAPRLYALTSVLLLLPAVWGAWRVHALVLEPGPVVGVVGTDLPLEAAEPALRTESAVDAVLRHLDGVGGVEGVEGVEGVDGLEGVDLVVLPEAVLRVTGPGATEARGRLERAAGSLGAPLLVGAYLDGAGGSAPPANGALLLLPRGGVGGVYEKRHLVPGVERAPFLAPAGRGGGFRAGREGALLEVAVRTAEPGSMAARTVRVGVLVCFESLFGPLARAYRAGGAEVLVALTDDAWLAEGAGGGAPEQHAAHLALRAAETRTGVVRAANRGWSGAVDPLGRRTGPGLRAGREGSLRVRVLRADVLTPYVRWGDWLGGGSALLCILVVATAAAPGFLRRLRRAIPGGPGG